MFLSDAQKNEPFDITPEKLMLKGLIDFLENEIGVLSFSIHGFDEEIVALEDIEILFERARVSLERNDDR